MYVAVPVVVGETILDVFSAVPRVVGENILGVCLAVPRVVGENILGQNEYDPNWDEYERIRTYVLKGP